MAKSIKIPKEVMEVFYEMYALGELAAARDEGFFPSLKAIYYKQKATKARVLAWRALRAAHPEVGSGDWEMDIMTGVATLLEAPAVPGEFKAVKKPRKPRAAKPAAPAAITEGEKV